MKLTFLGSGSFFAGPGNWHSNAVLEHNGKRLLIDCGSDARHSFREAGLQATDIDAVYISHLHDDHCGGVEWLGYANFFAPQRKKPKLFGDALVLKDLWDNRLKVAMGVIMRGDGFLDTYFEPNPWGIKFEWEGITFLLVQSIHVPNDKGKNGPMYSYGLYVQGPTSSFYFSTDVSGLYVNPASPQYRADVIFHDCETINMSEVHPHYNLLKTFPPEIKKKMWLYHTQSNVQPNAIDDGFLGIVQKGQVFEL